MDMKDGRPKSDWLCTGARRKAWKHLHPENRYRVRQAFKDEDGELHPVGESWEYWGYDYNAYHDGLTLFVSLDGAREWSLRLYGGPGGDPDAQKLDQYIEPA